jgi:uncharacterized membrane protein YciS (DUF1049 family)
MRYNIYSMDCPITQPTIYYNKISNVHDLDSYIYFMQCAWVQYAELISIALFVGFIIGYIIFKYYIYQKIHISNSEVI